MHLCPRSESQLTYMTPFVLTAEFALGQSRLSGHGPTVVGVDTV
jgi:hypothetical protein